MLEAEVWTYRRLATRASVEIGTVRGRQVALPPHFHDEDQIVVVHAGRRRFWIDGALVTVQSGGCVLIPAGVVHRSLDEPAGVECLNLYVPAGASDHDERPARRSVAERAARAGITREGFSRAFARRYGMPPHAFGLVARLNHARALLRTGTPIAAVAAEAGFADQSHLGRCFRRIFGVSPGRYRAG